MKTICVAEVSDRDNALLALEAIRKDLTDMTRQRDEERRNAVTVSDEIREHWKQQVSAVESRCKTLEGERDLALAHAAVKHGVLQSIFNRSEYGSNTIRFTDKLSDELRAALTPEPPAILLEIEGLRLGLTHPTIHMDYYEWLKEINADDFSKQFRDEHSRDFKEFDAIAMWAWSRSREKLKAKVSTAMNQTGETQP